MHLLKYFVLQADRMLMEYGPKIEVTYASIPQNVKNIMGDTSKYNVDFDDDSSPPSDKKPWSLVKKKSSVMDEEVEDLSSVESSVGGEESDEEYEDCNEDEAEDVPIEDGNDLVLSDPEGNTLAGHLMLNWNKRRKYLLHVISQVAHILSPNPVVQEFVKNGEVVAGKNAAEHLIKKVVHSQSSPW